MISRVPSAYCSVIVTVRGCERITYKRCIPERAVNGLFKRERFQGDLNVEYDASRTAPHIGAAPRS